jgi:hypothetical protein
VRKAKEFRDPVCVEKIVNVYLPTHQTRLLQYSDSSERSDRLQ